MAEKYSLRKIMVKIPLSYSEIEVMNMVCSDIVTNYNIFPIMSI